MAKINVKEAIEQYDALTVDIKELEGKRSRLKAVISDYVLRRGNTNHHGVSCYVISKKVIVWDVKKLWARLPKYRKTVIKTAVSVDLYKLVAEFAKLDITAEEVRAAIKNAGGTITRAVDDYILQSLVDKNKITIESLQGCYESNESKTVGIRCG